jgi:hypothetical protein
MHNILNSTQVPGNSNFLNVRLVNNNTALLPTDAVIIWTGVNGTITLPTVATGRAVYIVNHGTGTITLSKPITTGSGTTSTTITTAATNKYYHIVFDGTVWRRIGAN